MQLIFLVEYLDTFIKSRLFFLCNEETMFEA